MIIYTTGDSESNLYSCIESVITAIYEYVCKYIVITCSYFVRFSQNVLVNKFAVKISIQTE